MKKMLMFVYNDLSTDSRVQRSLSVLNRLFEITVICTGGAVDYPNVECIVIESENSGRMRYFDTILKTLSLMKSYKYDCLYLHDYYSCVLSLFVHRKKTVIYDAHELIVPDDNMPDNLRDKFFRVFEKRAVKIADLIIVANEQRGLLMSNYYHLRQPPFCVPNYSELPMDNGYSMSNELEQFFTSKKLTIVYAGALSYDREIDKLITEINNNQDFYKILIIGDGPAYNDLIRLASSCNGLDYLFMGSVPYCHLGTILSKCDIGFISYPKTNLNSIYCASNKIYEYASVKLPMLCNDNPSLKEVVGKNGIGLCVSDTTDAGCCGSIDEALKLINNNYAYYLTNIESFRSKNSWDTIATNYLREVDSIH